MMETQSWMLNLMRMNALTGDFGSKEIQHINIDRVKLYKYFFPINRSISTQSSNNSNSVASRSLTATVSPGSIMQM